mmetsp:Transcript_23544/g.58141  ORF Transcript_23544/g.58141 Transcript_23544/m.58141 type:complete len:230 (+) Transcript_23544:946-1635(+)
MTATSGGTVTAAIPMVTAVPPAIPNLACCHIWNLRAAAERFWNCCAMRLIVLAFSSSSSSFCPRSSSSSMLLCITSFTSPTCFDTIASLPSELACSILCSSVGANESCAASVLPVRHTGDSRSGSVRKMSFSRKPLACSSGMLGWYTQHAAHTIPGSCRWNLHAFSLPALSNSHPGLGFLARIFFASSSTAPPWLSCPASASVVESRVTAAHRMPSFCPAAIYYLAAGA